MNTNSIFGARRLGLAATVALGAGFATAGAAAASAFDSASVADGTLTVTGTNDSDRIALRLSAGDPNTLEVDFGDDGSAENRFDRSTFSQIVVSLRSGDDQFRIDQTGGAFADEAVIVEAGSGDDTITGGDGNELTIGGSGRDSVDGNRGQDTAFLGSGEDSFRWDPGDGSDVVEGDAGIDTLVFFGANGSERMSLSANGRRSVFLRDPGNIKMDMDDVERLDLLALGGADAITINDMTGTGFLQANVDLGVAGGGDLQADVVTVFGTDKADRIEVQTDGASVDVEGLKTATRISGGETIDRLEVDTLDRDDTVDVDDDVDDVIGVVVDLGAGQS